MKSYSLSLSNHSSGNADGVTELETQSRQGTKFSLQSSELGPSHPITRRETQSRQSTKLSLKSSELGLPRPLTCKRVCAPLLVPVWGGHTRLREGSGGSNSNEGTDTVVL